MQLLVVEDDVQLAGTLRRGLEEDGHVVAVAGNGLEGLSSAQHGAFDVIVLDVMLPGIDGFTLVRRLRESRNRTPVLMLTARDQDQDIVYGFTIGTDDYMTKPFSFAVLKARLHALARRGLSSDTVCHRVGDLTLNDAAREVRRGDELLSLTRLEHRVLRLLLRAEGRVLPRAELMEQVWGFDSEVGENSLDALISGLRVKVDRPGFRKLIHTVRGVGYMLREPAR